jgi:hypothetical protein
VVLSPLLPQKKVRVLDGSCCETVVYSDDETQEEDEEGEELVQLLQPVTFVAKCPVIGSCLANRFERNVIV